jgi:hypothetical protein
MLSIGKGRLIKNNMVRDDQSVEREIKAVVSFYDELNNPEKHTW